MTLTGPGGIGKTRLAMQVANQHQHETPAHVLIVELTSVADPDALPRAVASALRVTQQPGQSSVDALIEVLQPTPSLLVLDNCEHVIGASVLLAHALLRACPELRILATSREPLRVEGEIAWSVPSLSLPAEHARHSCEEVAESEPVRLFVERAQTHTPEFMLDEQNAPAVAQLCRKLDGIPLAIGDCPVWRLPSGTPPLAWSSLVRPKPCDWQHERTCRRARSAGSNRTWNRPGERSGPPVLSAPFAQARC